MTPLLIAADFSHWNGTIHWPQVAKAGIRICMLKATQGSSTDPEIEDWFADNADQAEAAGLAVIPYHFLDRSPMATQARHFIEVAEAEVGDTLAWDWESSKPGQNDAPYPATVDEFILAVEAVSKRDTLRYHGVAPPHGPPTPLMLQKPWWLPRYARNDNGTYWGDPGQACLFHQYTRKGIIAGVSGRCDRSAAYAPSVEAIMEWFRTGALPVSV